MPARPAIPVVLSVAVLLGGFATPGFGKDATMLIDAVRNGDLPQVRAALPTADMEAKDERGRTALLIATQANNIEIARELIEAGADVNAKDGMKDTPFLYAGAEGRDEILKLILATARRNSSDTNRYGGTALIPAAHHGIRRRCGSCSRQVSIWTTSTISAGPPCWRR